MSDRKRLTVSDLECACLAGMVVKAAGAITVLSNDVFANGFGDRLACSGDVRSGILIPRINTPSLDRSSTSRPKDSNWTEEWIVFPCGVDAY